MSTTLANDGIEDNTKTYNLENGSITVTAKFTVNQISAEDTTYKDVEDVSDDEADANEADDEQAADSVKSDSSKSPLTGNDSTILWAGFAFISISGIIITVMIKKMKSII